MQETYFTFSNSQTKDMPGPSLQLGLITVWSEAGLQEGVTGEVFIHQVNSFIQHHPERVFPHSQVLGFLSQAAWSPWTEQDFRIKARLLIKSSNGCTAGHSTGVLAVLTFELPDGDHRQPVHKPIGRNGSFWKAVSSPERLKGKNQPFQCLIYIGILI